MPAVPSVQPRPLLRDLNRSFRRNFSRGDVENLIKLCDSQAFVKFVRNVVEFYSFDTLTQRQKCAQCSARQEPDSTHVENQRATSILFNEIQDLGIKRIDAGGVADPAISKCDRSHFARLQNS